MAMVRLHKWIATQGLASRRQAERWIEYGRVEVNGTVERTLGRSIDPAKDKVRVDGELIATVAPNHVYWLLYKPDATITSKSDPENRQTIYNIPSLARIPFPVVSVGRLDYRTEGLLLLSNDGDLVNRLMHPKYHVPRVYDVLLPRRMGEKDLARFKQGIHLSDGAVGSVEIRPVGSKNLGGSRGYWYRLIVHEGRNRLVRRMFEKLGLRIIRLVRMAYGPIMLPEEMQPGEVVPLTPDQIQALKRAVELAPALPNRPVRRNSPRRPTATGATSSSGSPRTRVRMPGAAGARSVKQTAGSAPNPQAPSRPKGSFVPL
jgi:23S rRNA pseudouridine2605 synthase